LQQRSMFTAAAMAAAAAEKERPLPDRARSS